MKQDWKPGTMIYPLPAVLVSCGSCKEEYNIITVAWVGTICTNPPMCYISVRPTPLLSYFEEEYGVCYQSDNKGDGICYRLVWGALRKEF